MRGTVMNMQKGQHGPAMTMGVPSVFSTRENIPPICRAQQQNHRSISRRGSPEQSGCFFPAALSSSISLSHLADTAYLKQYGLVNHYSSREPKQTKFRQNNIIYYGEKSIRYMSLSHQHWVATQQRHMHAGTHCFLPFPVDVAPDDSAPLLFCSSFAIPLSTTPPVVTPLMASFPLVLVAPTGVEWSSSSNRSARDDDDISTSLEARLVIDYRRH